MRQYTEVYEMCWRAGICEREHASGKHHVVTCQKARLAGILLFVGLTLCVLAFGNVLECIEIESK